MLVLEFISNILYELHFAKNFYMFYSVAISISLAPAGKSEYPARPE